MSSLYRDCTLSFIRRATECFLWMGITTFCLWFLTYIPLWIWVLALLSYFRCFNRLFRYTRSWLVINYHYRTSTAAWYLAELRHLNPPTP